MDDNFKNGESFDRENFAEVNYNKDESLNEEKNAEMKESEGKKSKKGVWAALTGAVIIAAVLVFTAKTFIFSAPKAGLCNNYNSSIGIVKDKWLYHASVDGTEFAKTHIRTGEKKVISGESVAFIQEYKNNIYYYDSENEKYYRYNENGEDILIHDGAAYYPQFSGNYVYYIVPETAYGGFVKRTPIAGGEEETVLNVYCSSFYIESGNIIYYDQAIEDLLIVKLSDAIGYAEKAGGEAYESADIKAVVLLEDTMALNVNVKGRNIYYCDGGDSYKIKKLDMASGEITEIGRGLTGMYLNLYENYLYYVSPSDNRVYRCNLNGSDIRDLSGTNYARTAGISVYDGYMVYYALVTSYDENVQTQYTPVIVVSQADGKRVCEIPQNSSQDSGVSENTEGEENVTNNGEENGEA